MEMNDERRGMSCVNIVPMSSEERSFCLPVGFEMLHISRHRSFRRARFLELTAARDAVLFSLWSLKPPL